MKYYVEVVEVVKLKKVVPVEAESYIAAAQTVKKQYEDRTVALGKDDLCADSEPDCVSFYVSNHEDEQLCEQRRQELQVAFLNLGYNEDEISTKISDALYDERKMKLNLMSRQELAEELLKLGESLRYVEDNILNGTSEQQMRTKIGAKYFRNYVPENLSLTDDFLVEDYNNDLAAYLAGRHFN